MKRNELKSILEEFYNSSVTVNHILRGIRKPSYEKILNMNEKHNIPFTAWRDIKSYLQENDTPKKNNVQGNL